MKTLTLITLTAIAALSIAAASSAAPAQVFTQKHPFGQSLQRLIQLQQPENQPKNQNTAERLYFLKVKSAKLPKTNK